VIAHTQAFLYPLSVAPHRVLSVAALLVLLGSLTRASAQSCTGLCLQQVTCPAGGTTSISGTVYAPNGTDPLPNVTVYIPNATVDPLPAGVSCTPGGQTFSGSPLVGTTTAVNGTFTITNVPFGTNIPLVIQTGKWRRQVVVPNTIACGNTTFSTRMPKNQTEGDIPKIAISTGAADAVECVLLKVGIDQSEFTNPDGNGRINFYQADGAPGAQYTTSTSTTPAADALLNTTAALANYDVVMLPCEGTANYYEPKAQLSNLISYANSGGRIYTSHWSLEWLYNNAAFNTVVNWSPGQSDPSPDPGIATINTSFAGGQTLAQWLPFVNGLAGPDEVSIANLRKDFNGVVAPTRSWLALNDITAGNPVMQFTFDTPVGLTTGQCGRVLFNEYHVEDEAGDVSSMPFPTECSTTDTTTAQEKLLEYSLFDLTSTGSPAVIAPSPADLGSQPVGFPTAPLTLTWTNESVFNAAVSTVSATGDFSATASPACSSVASGASCNISVVFTPTVLGPRTGILSVGSAGQTLTSNLTGIGTADLSISSPTLNFGNTDLNSPFTQSLALTNLAPGPIPLGPLVTTGDFSAVAACGNSIAALSTCALNITFTPTATGPRTGTLAVVPSIAPFTGTGATLSGNGVDFTISVAPTSGSIIAGDSLHISATTTPIAGFASNLTLSCTTNAAGSTCTPVTPFYNGAGVTTTSILITTTSQYTVIGYTSGTSRGILALLALGSTLLLFLKRRTTAPLTRSGLILLILATASLSTTGCSGKLPDQNNPYTAPGSYTYTVSATDGILTHSATYTLNVTKK